MALEQIDFYLEGDKFWENRLGIWTVEKGRVREESKVTILKKVMHCCGNELRLERQEDGLC